jgi:hypothetical protein
MGRLLFFLGAGVLALFLLILVVGVLALLIRQDHEAQPLQPSKPYSRSSFGSWQDFDADCQDTRAEILVARSLERPVMDAKGCTVERGEWESYYTNTKLTEAASIDIDHLVPLRYAWEAGAHEWPDEKLRRFSNDPENLVVSSASVNRQKGARGPTSWLPISQAAACDYTTSFIFVLAKYDLHIGAQLPELRRSLCER